MHAPNWHHSPLRKAAMTGSANVRFSALRTQSITKKIDPMKHGRASMVISLSKEANILTDKSPLPHHSMVHYMETEDTSPPPGPLTRRKLEASVKDPTTLKILITRLDLSWPDCPAGSATKQVLSTLLRWQPWWFHFDGDATALGTC